jgi:hypothetical protein
LKGKMMTHDKKKSKASNILILSACLTLISLSVVEGAFAAAHSAFRTYQTTGKPKIVKSLEAGDSCHQTSSSHRTMCPDIKKPKNTDVPKTQ